MKILKCVCWLLFLVCVPKSVSGGIIVSVGNAQISPGGSTFLDVLIHSTQAVLFLDYYVIEYNLVPVNSAPSGGVKFTSPQTFDVVNDPGYVFFGNSDAFARDVTLSGSRLTVGDFTASALGVDLSNGSSLLTRLVVEAESSLLAGTKYRVDFSIPNTQFEDPNGNSIAFSGTSGDVTVASSVPEPSSILLLSCGAIVLFARTLRVRYRSNRKLK